MANFRIDIGNKRGNQPVRLVFQFIDANFEEGNKPLRPAAKYFQNRQNGRIHNPAANDRTVPRPSSCRPKASWASWNRFSARLAEAVQDC